MKTTSQQRARHDEERVGLEHASTLKEHPEGEVLAGAEPCVVVWNVALKSNKDE